MRPLPTSARRSLAVAGLATVLVAVGACSSSDGDSIATTAASAVSSPATTAPPTSTTPASTSTDAPTSTSAPTTAAPTTTDATDGMLSTMLRTELTSHADDPLVGAVVGIEVPGDDPVVVTAGEQSTEPGAAPVDPSIPWAIGSVTKTFVAVVVLQLVDEGAFALDDPIGPLLEGTGIELADADTITVRELLQHTSGLPEYIDDPAITSQGDKVWTPAELVAVADAHGRVDVPGGGHHYANTNYVVLGEIIRHATGRTWDDEVRQRIVEPLGLGSTGPIGGERSPGYVVVDGQPVEVVDGGDPSVGGAAGAMQSTVADLLVYVGALRDGTLVSPEMREAMLQMVDVGDLTDLGVEHTYGLGIERYALGGVEVIGHLGVATPAGQSAFIGWDPSTGTLIAVQLNIGVGGPQAFIAIEALTAARAL
ncbi:MAG: serine hydrolase domain-containing protein [Acidimicrobiales bacterium]